MESCPYSHHWGCAVPGSQVVVWWFEWCHSLKSPIPAGLPSFKSPSSPLVPPRLKPPSSQLVPPSLKSPSSPLVPPSLKFPSLPLVPPASSLLHFIKMKICCKASQTLLLWLRWLPSAPRLLLQQLCSAALICLGLSGLQLHPGVLIPWLHLEPLSPGLNLALPTLWLHLGATLPRLHRGSTGLLLPSGSAIVLTSTASAWVCPAPVSTSFPRACDSTLTLQAFCVNLYYLVLWTQYRVSSRELLTIHCLIKVGLKHVMPIFQSVFSMT